jgi:hypothetical protein
LTKAYLIDMINRLLSIIAFLVLLPLIVTEMTVRVALLLPLYILYGNTDIVNDLFTGEFYLKIENKLGL